MKKDTDWLIICGKNEIPGVKKKGLILTKERTLQL
jgi:hypothetical protein